MASRERTSPPTRRKRTSTTRNEVVFALALGGNLGPVEQTLRRALRDLEAALGPLHAAPLYRSAAVFGTSGISIPQPGFLNTAALGRTALPPDAVLAVAKALERNAGRRRGRRFGPRPLDVDLLLYGDLQSAAPELTLPHPRLRERRFVLEPLGAIAPDLRVPPDGATVRELLGRVMEQEVKRVEGRD